MPHSSWLILTSSSDMYIKPLTNYTIQRFDGTKYSNRELDQSLTGVLKSFISFDVFQGKGSFTYFQTSTLPHFHTFTLPHSHTSTLPHFHTSTLPHFYTSTPPSFHTSITHCQVKINGRKVRKGLFAYLHICIFKHFDTSTLPHFHTTKLLHYHTSTLPHYHTTKLR